MELLQRLSCIGRSLERSKGALALLGLGSVGRESERLDEYSDLDFFVVVESGLKAHFLNNLEWMEACGSSSFHFRNTKDGYKYFYDDGVLCEFAVFESRELSHIPYQEGRLIWHVPNFDVGLARPQCAKGHYRRSEDLEWLLGEALTNLYVGMCRFRRGEKLSGMRLIQIHAVDRIMDLLHRGAKPNSCAGDPFAPDRRVEFRYPEAERMMVSMCQGYERVPESAMAQLDWLETHFEINEVIASEIRRLGARGDEASCRS